MTDAVAATSIDIGEILARIPHRYPFLLVDRAEDYVPGESITGIKAVSINEAFFQGHFPDYPVMPGVLIVEAMAQTGAVSHSFLKKGQFLIGASQIGEDALMELVLEAGAEDVVNNGDHFEVLSPISAFDAISKALQEKSIKPESAELAYISSIPVPVGDAAVAKQVLELIDALEALDDVKAVHGNQEIDEKLMS